MPLMAEDVVSRSDKLPACRKARSGVTGVDNPGAPGLSISQPGMSNIECRSQILVTCSAFDIRYSEFDIRHSLAGMHPRFPEGPVARGAPACWDGLWDRATRAQMKPRRCELNAPRSHPIGGRFPPAEGFRGASDAPPRAGLSGRYRRRTAASSGPWRLLGGGSHVQAWPIRGTFKILAGRRHAETPVPPGPRD